MQRICDPWSHYAGHAEQQRINGSLKPKRSAMAEIPILASTAFERTGSCLRWCGRCCSVALWEQHPDYGSRLKPIFDVLGKNSRGECAKLRWVNGMAVCESYENRPEVCRVFPNHPLSVELVPECTYQFKEKEA